MRGGKKNTTVTDIHKKRFAKLVKWMRLNNEPKDNIQTPNAANKRKKFGMNQKERRREGWGSRHSALAIHSKMNQTLESVYSQKLINSFSKRNK